MTWHNLYLIMFFPLTTSKLKWAVLPVNAYYRIDLTYFLMNLC